MTIGRPLKYSPEIEERICNALRAGMSREGSARYGGINEQTFHNWMKRFSSFSSAVIAAESACELRASLTLRQAFEAGDWRAALEWLKRRRPNEWAEIHRIEIVNQVRQLAEEMGADPQAAADEAERYLKELRRAQRS